MLVSAALLILIVFILAIILGSWVGYTNSKILADSYNNYLNQTKGVISSIFGFFHH